MADDPNKTALEPTPAAPTEGDAPQADPKALTVEELSAQIKTQQEQLKALQEQYEKQKKATDNASADAADWKRKYRATQTEAERAEADRKEAAAQEQARYAAIERENTVLKTKASYLTMGYSDELAQQAAEALADGNITKALEVQAVARKAWEDDYKAKLLGQQPKLTPGTTPTKETIASAELAKIRRAAGLE